MALFRGSVFRKVFHKSKSNVNIRPVYQTPRSKTFTEPTEFVDDDEDQPSDVEEKTEKSARSARKSVPIKDANEACDKIKAQIKEVSEEVCTVISLIPLLSTIEEGREMDEKIKQLDVKIQALLPPLHYFTTSPPPVSVNSNLWDLERQQINREFDSTVQNFRAAQRMIQLELMKLNSKKRF